MFAETKISPSKIVIRGWYSKIIGMKTVFALLFSHNMKEMTKEENKLGYRNLINNCAGIFELSMGNREPSRN